MASQLKLILTIKYHKVLIFFIQTMTKAQFHELPSSCFYFFSLMSFFLMVFYFHFHTYLYSINLDLYISLKDPFQCYLNNCAKVENPIYHNSIYFHLHFQFIFILFLNLFQQAQHLLNGYYFYRFYHYKFESFIFFFYHLCPNKNYLMKSCFNLLLINLANLLIYLKD